LTLRQGQPVHAHYSVRQGGPRRRGATVQLNADLDTDAYTVAANQPAEHTLLVWVLEP
jgi:hypothetical protein